MGMLHDTKSQEKKSGGRSRQRRSSSVPQSLPDLESSKRIESLEKELAEAKASGETSRQEITDLKAQLADAKSALLNTGKTASTSETASQIQEVRKDDERKERQSFFGV